MTTIPVVSASTARPASGLSTILPGMGWLAAMTSHLRLHAARQRTDVILAGLDARQREDIGATPTPPAGRPVFLAGFHPRIPVSVLVNR